MAGELGFDMVDKVIKALDEAGYHDQTSQKVMIQSTDSSVLEKFKEQTKYDLVYMINKEVGDAAPSSLADIKKFASAVSVNTSSVFPETHYFTVYETNLVQKLQTAGLSVYVYTLMNEFPSQPYDFFSDATVEINAYVKGALVDGLITDFPATARRYKGEFRFPFLCIMHPLTAPCLVHRASSTIPTAVSLLYSHDELCFAVNNCMNMGNSTPNYMAPAHPGDLLQSISKSAQPPALAPIPPLTESDVVQQPLPPARTNSSTAPTQSPASRTHACAAHIPVLVTLAMLCAWRSLV